MFYLDIQVVAHGHHCQYRRTSQPSVVHYSMLDASCPSGNSYKISSFNRLNRSASSRYKKYRHNLVFKYPIDKNLSTIPFLNQT